MRIMARQAIQTHVGASFAHLKATALNKPNGGEANDVIGFRRDFILRRLIRSAMAFSAAIDVLSGGEGFPTHHLGSGRGSLLLVRVRRGVDVAADAA